MRFLAGGFSLCGDPFGDIGGRPLDKPITASSIGCDFVVRSGDAFIAQAVEALCLDLLQMHGGSQ